MPPGYHDFGLSTTGTSPWFAALHSLVLLSEVYLVLFELMIGLPSSGVQSACTTCCHNTVVE